MATQTPVQPVTPPRRRPAPTLPQPMAQGELAEQHAKHWRVHALSPRSPGQEG